VPSACWRKQEWAFARLICVVGFLATAVKKAVDVPVITAGLIVTGELAEQIVKDGKADLIGLARVLWTDPEWPQKVMQDRENEILQCDSCNACIKIVMKGKPAVCVR
jgi:NADPH2 dehydrogenase